MWDKAQYFIGEKIDCVNYFAKQIKVEPFNDDHKLLLEKELSISNALTYDKSDLREHF